MGKSAVANPVLNESDWRGVEPPSLGKWRDMSKEFMMWDNGYNTLMSKTIFDGLMYRVWMHRA